MLNLPPPPSLASAAAVFFGRYGDVTHLAHQRAVCRQALYREAHAAAATVAGTALPQSRDALRQRVAQLEQQGVVLREQLRQAVLVSDDRQAEFAATAQALGVSLSAARALLRVVLRDRTPSVATLGRFSRAAGRRAGTLLAVLDEYSRPQARQLAADELFSGRKPVLMVVEQASMCWLTGCLAADRSGATWAEHFRAFPAATQITRDRGNGLVKGVARLNAARRAAGQPAVADQDDHYHALHWGSRALREVKRQALKALAQAEAAQQPLDSARRRGQSVHGSQVRAAQRRWQQAEQAWDRWVAQAWVWEQLRAALRLFTPEGVLNTRAHAAAEVRAALELLDGPEWERLRSWLASPQVFTYLDGVQEQLAALPVPEALRQAAREVEEWRRRPEVLGAEGARAATARGVLLLAGVLLALAGEAGEQALALVRGVLEGVWRASSLVEGLNSVVRMQQARQKRLTQELLDLKRLHWNLHVFAAGKRKGHSPYRRLGLKLPEGDWWELLNKPPEQLRQELSALNPAA